MSDRSLFCVLITLTQTHRLSCISSAEPQYFEIMNRKLRVDFSNDGGEDDSVCAEYVEVMSIYL